MLSSWRKSEQEEKKANTVEDLQRDKVLQCIDRTRVPHAKGSMQFINERALRKFYEQPNTATPKAVGSELALQSFSALGLLPDAPQEEIQSAYFTAAGSLLVASQNPAYSEKMRHEARAALLCIGSVTDVLSDPHLRRIFSEAASLGSVTITPPTVTPISTSVPKQAKVTPRKGRKFRRLLLLTLMGGSYLAGTYHDETKKLLEDKGVTKWVNQHFVKTKEWLTGQYNRIVSYERVTTIYREVSLKSPSLDKERFQARTARGSLSYDDRN